MYKFKIEEAQTALKGFHATHSNNAYAKRALKGDAAAMLEVYREMAGDSEYDEGPSLEALQVLNEACQQKHTPAMIRMAQVEMCQGWKYWPEGLNLLLEAKELGDQAAENQLHNDWNIEAKELLHVEEPLNKYQLYVLGFFYWHGIAVRKSVKKAESYMLRSAAKGCSEAEGLIRQKYPKTFQKKIKAEKIETLRRKGMWEEDERRDNAEALKYYSEAIELGDVKSFHFCLGIIDDLHSDIFSTLQRNAERLKVSERDLETVRRIAWISGKIPAQDEKRLFVIAQKYNVLLDCITERREAMLGWEAYKSEFDKRSCDRSISSFYPDD